jgi:hypothetical protein
MKNLSKTQIEKIETLGGTVHEDYISFQVENQEWGEHCEDKERIWKEIQTIVPGIDGALQGLPYDESDMDYIYFKLDF